MADSLRRYPPPWRWDHTHEEYDDDGNPVRASCLLGAEDAGHRDVILDASELRSRTVDSDVLAMTEAAPEMLELLARAIPWIEAADHFVGEGNSIIGEVRSLLRRLGVELDPS